MEPIDHDAGWEYLYLASEIARGLHDLDEPYEHYMSGECKHASKTATPARRKQQHVIVS